MEDLINQLISHKTRCYFISPHLDDAAFSAGELIIRLAKNIDVTVVNVFTKAGGGKDSLSARAYLKQANAKDKTAFFQERIAEDNAAFSPKNVKIVNLGFEDALWRVDEMGKLLYPTYRLHVISGNISKRDKKNVAKITQSIGNLFSGHDSNFVIFAPAGIGKHIDHIVARISVSKFPNVIYWADFPYRIKSGNANEFIKKHRFTPRFLSIQSIEKKELCMNYKTQVNQVINDERLFFESELYFLPGATEKLKLKAEAVYKISPKLVQAWQELWDHSEMAHSFNSPSWFLACQAYNKTVPIKLITIYNESKLVGILPNIESKIFGIRSLKGPGGDFLDRSSLLLLRFDPRLIDFMFCEIKTFGKIYLNELSEEVANYLNTYFRDFIVAKDSINHELTLGENPIRYLKKKHIKQIRKIIDEEKDLLVIKYDRSSSASSIKIISEIEAKSGKSKTHSAVFSDKELTGLITNLRNQKNCDCLITILYFKGEPIAYEYGFVYRNTWHLYQMGFKEGYSHLSPGRVLLYQTLLGLSEQGISKVDFSRGSNRLKTDFTEHHYRQYLVFFSDNKLVNNWWKTASFSFNKLTEHPRLFETLRGIKHKVLHD